YNTAALALLTHMLAQQCDLVPHEIIVTLGDAQAYANHKNQIDTQLARVPKKLPRLKINRKPKSIYDYKFEDFEIVGYEADPSIKAPVAI
ncbi:thymidylate synthase, partial [Pseudomonas viridiflava]|uniref:thymidylate synthase n=1 Tax=Pseudomonas viridiflava TaxID=33069 RepID=UPI0013D1EAE2